MIYTDTEYEQNALNLFNRVIPNVDHSQSTFHEHCKGVYEILKEYECPEYLTVAGLFHSCLGTEYFPIEIKNIRSEIKVLKNETLNLVYLFCETKDRTSSIIDGTISLNKRQLQDLRWVEYANLYEQMTRAESTELILQVQTLVEKIKEFKE